MSAPVIIRGKNRIRVVFPSEVSMVDEMASEAIDFVKDFKLKLDFFAFRLALLEGLTNAVKHGNKEDPMLEVIFEISIENNILLISIEDAGPGFDWKKACARAETPILGAPRGRGIHLMKHCGYTPIYNESGNLLCFRVNLDELKKLSEEKQESGE